MCNPVNRNCRKIHPIFLCFCHRAWKQPGSSPGARYRCIV
nr:MAG TPA: hypothetical protein [Bacteriophage sp.]DAJ65638.1 MAG TPA: hypothetical protein [Caudoviricetes sp.]DAT68534.1 MAG TPA: hypothetical protein [Caudoviricetes sp.]